ncbi:acyl-CoA dehydrogenase family protein [Streptomyces kanamyceticus]|uniref:Acyl-CoA dehydrogenase n=1 Tax=Streptomyces kanamyceticus TaxID=1967 RepID=A0A5J6G9S1_STRKN|nr:acyl-CoA dehydrogenase family protein [Streptomyces kanamyceticus]QEU90685.1 acyl-CoA dehydrogenase [Streptomyces kanamyceticus]
MTPRAHAADVMNRGDLAHATLDDEVERVRLEARHRFGGFVLDHVNPGSYFLNHERRALDKRLFEQAGDLGLLRFSLPVDAGGDGRDKLAWGVVVEEIARLSRDPGFAVLLDITVEITELILSSGSPELIDAYVPDLLSGRRFGVQGAYENRDPYDYRSTARLEGDTWVLNGAKRFLAGARFADLFILFLRDEASNDMLAFAVQKDDPGVSAVHMDTMGLHTMGLGQVVLHDVRLPAWRLVWRADALSELNTYARIRRTMSACGVLGALDGVVDACVESLTPRRRGGRPVLDYTNVERTVGEMRMLLQSARAGIHRALDGTRSPGRDPHFDEFATVAKHQAAECALRVGRLVMGLQGGEAYMSAFPWERFMRDILGLVSGQGSQETLLIQLGQRAIVGLEGRRVREDAAERSVARCADAWWALHAVERRHTAPGGLADAVGEMTTAAGLDGDIAPEQLAAVTGLLDRAHALLAAVRSGQAPTVLPPGPAGLFEGRLAEVAEGAWTLVACAVAHESGLLNRLVRPATAKEAADGLSEDLTEGLLRILADASLVRGDEAGRHAVEPGLERVLIGGPRAAAFAARLRRTVIAGARLRAGTRGLGRTMVPGCGGEAAVLADALVDGLLGRLEGLPWTLDAPGARVGCAAADGGRTAAQLARHIPSVPVLALEPEQVVVPPVGRGGGRAPERTATDRIQVRAGDRAGFAADDRLALAWLPAGGRTAEGLRQAVTDAVGALLPGGWLVVPCPLPPKRPLGAAAVRLELAVAGGAVPSEADVEESLRDAGLGQVRVAWEDAALGLRLFVGRRP